MVGKNGINKRGVPCIRNSRVLQSYQSFFMPHVSVDLWDVQDVVCLGCRTFEMWDVGV